MKLLTRENASAGMRRKLVGKYLFHAVPSPVTIEEPPDPGDL